MDGEQSPEAPRRLNQILSLAGVTSRRKADVWIREGRVSINGRTVRQPGTRAVWGLDRIAVDGRPLAPPTRRIYVMLNKPFGYICALEDPKGRPVVTQLLEGLPQRVYPVGRLDFDTLGLLLLTNDGLWAARLMHPRYRIPRTYKVTAAGSLSEEAVRMLRQGVMLGDGRVAVGRVRVLQREGARTLLRITITQGRNRQVRRMLEAAGHPVIHLMRTGFGPLTLGTLKVGEYRFLEPGEVKAISRLVGL